MRYGPSMALPSALLLSWFDREKRDLPWRHTKDAYAVWLSEIMLQQTRVDTVIPYYRRFLARFPTVEALAAAPIEDVLAQWSGLGYYRRARGLHACAREVVARHHARFPQTAAQLAALPGVGEYTAGAVASIAHGERAVAVDGNVTRVVSRLLAIDEPVEAPRARRLVREGAAGLLDPIRPGDSNQALMELGATVCTKAAPACERCPVSEHCRARAEGRERELPPAKKRPASPRVGMVAALAFGGAGVLLARRPEAGLFAGLWEPPMIEGAVASAKKAFARAGIALASGAAPASVVHVLTHRVLDVAVFRARVTDVGDIAPYVELAFVPESKLAALPMSTLARRVLRVSFADA